ncbi:unnamed protein product [Closterium sp. NIES-64]|nr:unnamed protein product [Closterium sp. NIES-64]
MVMAITSVLAFDAEGRAIDFDVWVDDLQLFLQCDRADGLSLFDLTSGASPAPAADADATVRSQWATRDAAARLAVRRHLPTSELTHLPDSLRVVRDHFLSVCPTTLTVDLLEKALLAAEKSIVAVGASCGDPRTPIFEGCSPSPLLPSFASAAAVDLLSLESVVEAEAAVAVAVGAEVAEVAAVEEAAEAALVAEAAVVAEAAEAAEAAGVAVELVAGLHRGVASVVVRASSSSVVVRPRPLSSSVSGTLHASGVGVLVRAPTSCAPATVRVSSVGVRTPPSAALAA